MRKSRGKLFLMLPLLFSFGVSAGEIKGTVRDSKSSEPLGGATVSVTSSALPNGETTMTEENGQYRFSNLPAGTYTVTANYAGAHQDRTIVIAEGDREAQNVELMVAESEAKASVYTITGTRIRSTNSQAVSPVTSVSETDIKDQGSTRIEDIINTLPQAFAAQGSTVSNGSNGTATVDLRGLGTSRTLVLIDGRRLGPGNPNSFPTTPAIGDLNFIPASIIERIDVLTGGASAVYGADAVAGVVNFITKKDFEGVQLDLEWGVYGHHQQETQIQALINAQALTNVNPSFYAVPGDVWNITGPSISVTMGVNSPDGKGNVTAYGAYRLDYAILQSDRDFSACALESGDFFTCGGSSTTSPARIGNNAVTANPNTTAATNLTTLTPFGSANYYNFAPLNYFLRPDERYNLGALAHYKLAPFADVYAQVMYLNDNSVGQVAPGGIFASEQTVDCANPFLTASELTTMCGGSKTGSFNGIVGRRNVEGGGRQDAFLHSAYRLVGGLRGDLGHDWNYDVYYQWMVTDYSHSAQNYFDTQHITNALNVVTDTRVGSPTLGQPVCQSVIDGSDPTCVPYNIFQVGPNGQSMVTPAMLSYLQVPGYDGGVASERVVDLNFTGNLGAYGVRSPFAKDGVSVSAGGEYRGQSVSYYADYLLTNGFLSGTSGVSIPLAQSFNVYEAFAEVRVPLAQDIILLKNVQFEGAYRYSNYSFGKDTHTFKVGGEWEFLEDMRVRSSWQRAVRAPSITELYSPDAVQLDGSTDPCAGLAAGDPLVATCAAAFGLTTAQVLAIVPNPAAQYNGLLGGNANLNPESSDTVSVGFVVQPTFLRGLQLSVDYFTIKVNGAVSTIGADLILKNCLSGANPAYCSLVHRDAQGSLWLSPQGYVVDTNQNVSFLGTSGIDVNLLYALRLRDIGAGKMGTVSLAFNGTWLATQTTQPTVTQATYDCTGLYGTVCGIPNPLWRHKLKLTWDAPLGLSVSGQMRYLSAVGLDANSSQAALNNPGQVAISDLSLGARAYFDLVGSWTIADMITFRAGVNNVLDTDPPLSGSANLSINGGGNGNTVPQAYDALGRYIFLSGTAKF